MAKIAEDVPPGPNSPPPGQSPIPAAPNLEMSPHTKATLAPTLMMLVDDKGKEIGKRYVMVKHDNISDTDTGQRVCFAFSKTAVKCQKNFAAKQEGKFAALITVEIDGKRPFGVALRTSLKRFTVIRSGEAEQLQYLHACQKALGQYKPEPVPKPVPGLEPLRTSSSDIETEAARLERYRQERNVERRDNEKLRLSLTELPARLDQKFSADMLAPELFKIGDMLKASGGPFSQYQKRWFQLKGGKLKYFKAAPGTLSLPLSPDVEPAGVIDMSNVKEVKDASNLDAKYPNRIFVTTMEVTKFEPRTYDLQIPDSDDEFQDWLAKLKTAQLELSQSRLEQKESLLASMKTEVELFAKQISTERQRLSSLSRGSSLASPGSRLEQTPGQEPEPEV